MFEKLKLQTGEKQLCPQTMQSVSRIRNLLNSAMLIACSFTYTTESSAENIVDGNEDVMQIYADIIDLQCQYNFEGNLNPNILEVGVRTETIGRFDQLSIFPNKGDGFNFIDNNGNCYKTESLTDDTEVIFVDTELCATTSFENLRFNNSNSGNIDIPNSGDQLLPSRFGANAIDNHDGFSPIRADKPLMNIFRPDINVSFSKRWFYIYAKPTGSDNFSTDVFWVTDFTVLIPFDEVENYMQNNVSMDMPTALRIDYPLQQQSDRMQNYRLLSPYFLVATNSNITEIFAFDEAFKVWTPSSVLNPELLDSLNYENGNTYVADNRYAFKEYRISSIQNNTASVEVLSCTLRGEEINNQYHVLSDLNQPYPDDDVIEEIIDDEPDMELPQDEPDMELPQDEPDMELPQDEPDMELPQDEADMELPQDETDMELPQDEADMELPQNEPDMELPQNEPDMELPQDDQMFGNEENSLDAGSNHSSNEDITVDGGGFMQEHFYNTVDTSVNANKSSAERDGCSANPNSSNTTSLWMASILLLGVRIRKKFSLQK